MWFKSLLEGLMHKHDDRQSLSLDALHTMLMGDQHTIVEITLARRHTNEEYSVRALRHRYMEFQEQEMKRMHDSGLFNNSDRSVSTFQGSSSPQVCLQSHASHFAVIEFSIRGDREYGVEDTGKLVQHGCLHLHQSRRAGLTLGVTDCYINVNISNFHHGRHRRHTHRCRRHHQHDSFSSPARTRQNCCLLKKGIIDIRAALWASLLAKTHLTPCWGCIPSWISLACGKGSPGMQTPHWNCRIASSKLATHPCQMPLSRS